ncbi:hypothetical protein DM02DRAFT_730398 [Periconia macrospinosa]|uniref:CUE domain-containing protein n=1 Tax=Periconia macrospinosa TaxID=97972 RepID=A0A2V1DKQ1_9PLEO|nr:hypothetical protein DM02DRAFT_730398 [Periconia macrospinosa]
MSLPQFVPFPAKSLRQEIAPKEWELYLDAWTSLAELYLRLADQEFASAISTENSSVVDFLISFFHELANDDSILPTVLTLRRRCFHLLHRIFSGQQVPPLLLRWPVLSDICRCFPKSEQLRNLLAQLWKREGTVIEKNLQLAKTSLIRNLESKMPENAEETLNKLVPLLKVSSDAGTYMATGSDFMDSLTTAYPSVSHGLQVKLTATAFLGLTALLEGQKPSLSTLSDHLYSLKANGEQRRKSATTQGSLVANLVTNTPFLTKVRDKATALDATRVKNFAAELSIFQEPSIARPRKLVRRKVDKGKSKATTHELDHGPSEKMHVHRMALISQIQDLFPNLGSGFIAKLLDEYNDDVEVTTAHLLEESLPPQLANADRNEQLPSMESSTIQHVPQSVPAPPTRRNVFDNDELDRLAIDASQLHIGRRNQELTADRILNDRQDAPSKSAILSALAAFDSDDDERDDTYDVEDVGGTVDSTTADDSNLQDKNEEVLFKAYSTTPAVFGRDAATRRGTARAALKSETGMTDESIEGWGIMIARDPKRLRRLEAKFATFGGQQTELAQTAWRASAVGSDGEDTGSGDGQRGGRGGSSGRGRGRGSGRGRGGGGRGRGNAAGPADDKSTQIARQRKDQNKGSRANHNRRDQRARKMARGGLAG